MATNALSTRTSRRAILAAALSVPTLAAASTYRSRPRPSGRIGAGFTSALKLVEQRKAEHDDHEHNIYRPAYDRAQVAIAALPHTTVDAGPSMGGGRVIWSTDKPMAVARTIVEMGREGKDVAGAGLAEARQIVAADLRRQRAIDRIHRDHGLTDSWERSNMHSDRWAEAESAVAAYPVSTLAELASKLEHLIAWDMEGWHETLLADTRRIAAQEV